MSLVVTSDLADRRVSAPVVPSHADLIVLNRRPGAVLLPGDLVRDRRALPKPAPGEVVVRNILTTVDGEQLPLLRGFGRAQVAIGDPIPATSIGRVVRSADPAVPVGTQVRTSTGWQTFATTRIASDEIADRRLGSPLEWVSVLDTTGVVAYLGIHDIGGVRPGATVVVTEAAGALGAAAVQLAGAAGARVVAMVGGRYRVRRDVEVLGADTVVDYLEPGFPGHLRAAVGEGVDLFFDNSGDQHLQLALSVIKDQGSIVLCGPGPEVVRPGYPDPDGESTPGVMKRVTLRGHLVGQRTGGRLHPIRAELAATTRSYVVSDDYAARLAEIRADLAQLVRAKRLRAMVSESEGLDRAPAALAIAAGRGLSLAGRCVVWISEAEQSEGELGERRCPRTRTLLASAHR
jgi:NADPH-dependent curcumin reductase CurA